MPGTWSQAPAGTMFRPSLVTSIPVSVSERMFGYLLSQCQANSPFGNPLPYAAHEMPLQGPCFTYAGDTQTGPLLSPFGVAGAPPPPTSSGLARVRKPLCMGGCSSPVKSAIGW